MKIYGVHYNHHRYIIFGHYFFSVKLQRQKSWKFRGEANIEKVYFVLAVGTRTTFLPSNTIFVSKTDHTCIQTKLYLDKHMFTFYPLHEKT